MPDPLKVSVSFYINTSLLVLELPDERLPRSNDIPGQLADTICVDDSFMRGTQLYIKLAPAVHQGKRRLVFQCAKAALHALELEIEEGISFIDSPTG